MKGTHWNLRKDIPNYGIIFCKYALNNECNKSIHISGLPAPFYFYLQGVACELNEFFSVCEQVLCEPKSRLWFDIM